MTASCFIHSVLFLFPLRIMGCGKEETKPTRASPSWTPALSAWPRLAQTHKHAINADIYDTLTSSGGQNKWEQSFQRTGGTGAPVKMSGTVKGAQRPLRWPLEDPDSTELSLDHILYWKYLLSRSMSVNVQINCEVKSVPEQGRQSCFFFFKFQHVLILLNSLQHIWPQSVKICSESETFRLLVNITVSFFTQQQPGMFSVRPALSSVGIKRGLSCSLWSSKNGFSLRNNIILSAHTHTFNLRLWKQAPLQDLLCSVNYVKLILFITADLSWAALTWFAP